MIILAAQNIQKAFGINTVLDGISLHVKEGEKIGLIGNNGSGKTTLMRILAGADLPDAGTITKAKQLRIGYLQQHATFDGEQTLWDTCLGAFAEVIRTGERVRALTERIAVQAHEDADYEQTLAEYQKQMDAFEKMEGYQMESSIRGVLHGLGFSQDQYEQKVGTFSGGQKSRVLLAVLLLEKPDLLLMDEPTNHLDIRAVEWLEEYLKGFAGTLVVISHDRYFLDAVTNRTAYLGRSLTTYTGNYTAFMEKRKQEMEIQQRAYENQRKEIERQEEIIRRFENYGGERYLIQARSRRKMLEHMDKVAPPDARAKQMQFSLQPARESGKDVLDVENLGMAFDTQPLFSGVTFHVTKGERIGMIGPNGIGKTTLFRILQERIRPTEGQFTVGTGVTFGYLDQELRDLDGDQTILDEIWDARPDLKHGEIRNVLAAFSFYGDDIFKSVGDLSGGEKTRVALCKLMLSKCNTLLLDEPTNHLDIESKEALENACTQYAGTLFFISHDRYFLNRVANRILVLQEDGVTSYLGNYEYYVEKSAPEDVQEEVVINQTQEQKERKRDRATKQRLKQQELRRKEAEDAIREAEAKLAQLDQELADPSVYENRNRVELIVRERQSLSDQLAQMYEDWLELVEE